jgi:hypothetical protein
MPSQRVRTKGAKLITLIAILEFQQSKLFSFEAVIEWSKSRFKNQPRQANQLNAASLLFPLSGFL